MELQDLEQQQHREKIYDQADEQYWSRLQEHFTRQSKYYPIYLNEWKFPIHYEDLIIPAWCT